MRAILDMLRAPSFAIRTVHEAHQYAKHRQQFSADWRKVFDRGYQAGYEARKQEQP